MDFAITLLDGAGGKTDSRKSGVDYVRAGGLKLALIRPGLGSTLMMSTLMPYDVSVFQGLNEFHTSKRLLGESEGSVGELGDVICAFELHHHVGISLLHQHFELDDDEMLVREYQDGIAHMTPRSTEAIAQFIPYLWRLKVENGQRRFYPLEFCDYPAELRKQASEEVGLIERSDEFLAALADKLTQLELADVFGIMSLAWRPAVSFKPGETLLETTDEENRILTLRPAPQAEVDAIDTTQTLWLFTPPLGQGFLRGECSGHCISHCYNHPQSGEEGQSGR